MKILISILIILLIFASVVSSINHLVKYGSYGVYENNCKTVYHQTGDRNIVLRIDDIQSNFIRDLQMRMIEDALNRNKTLSLAIIPINLDKDREIFRFLTENKCKLEIALHGHDNTDFEFSRISYKEADEKLKKGLETLNKIEPNIMTFVPPNNAFSKESEQAVYDNNIEIISAGYWNSKYGFSISTYDWKIHRLRSHTEVLQECKKDLDEYEICIIMMHPQDYASDWKFDAVKYGNYINLLDKIDKLNATVVTFRDLYYKDIIRLN